MKKSKTRNSNFELLRIIAMLMIITYHIYAQCIKAQLTDSASIARMANGFFCNPVFSKKLFLLAGIAPFGKVGDVIFILISGYFLATKGKGIDISKSAKKLLTQLGGATIFLTIASFLFFTFTGGEIFTGLIDILYFNNNGWFAGYYFMLLVIAKLFLNGYLEKLDQTKYTEFLIIMFSISQLVATKWIIDTDGGALRVLISGIFLYSLGGYVARYNPFDKIKTFTLILIPFVTYIFIFLSQYNISQNNIQTYIRNASKATFVPTIIHFTDRDFVPIILGIVVFELFRRIKVPTSKIINYLGSSCFFVFLLHDSKFTYKLWDTQDWISLLYKQPLHFMGKIVVWAIGTFLICVLAYSLYVLLCKLFSKCRFLFIKQNVTK